MSFVEQVWGVGPFRVSTRPKTEKGEQICFTTNSEGFSIKTDMSKDMAVYLAKLLTTAVEAIKSEEPNK